MYISFINKHIVLTTSDQLPHPIIIFKGGSASPHHRTACYGNIYIYPFVFAPLKYLNPMMRGSSEFFIKIGICDKLHKIK
jgi:hypothetical protein